MCILYCTLLINYFVVWLNEKYNMNTTSANINLRAVRVFIYWMRDKEEIKQTNEDFDNLEK